MTRHRAENNHDDALPDHRSLQPSLRIVLYEKGMDFQIIDVDLFNKPEDLAALNPYNQTPVLVERDLILYESNIINEYIDERFPHPQLMPPDPVMRARARLFLHRFEKELFTTSMRSRATTRSRSSGPATSFATASCRSRPCSPSTSTCWATSIRCSTSRLRRFCGGSTITVW
jgi:glutathione S-transferase